MAAVDRAAAAALLLASCALWSYEPTTLDTPPLDGSAFARCRHTVLASWGSLAVVDPDGFRLQTPWLPHQEGTDAGQKRATVFRDGEVRLAVVVEVRWLRVAAGGLPGYSGSRSDRGLERQLADALAAALAGG